MWLLVNGIWLRGAEISVWKAGKLLESDGLEIRIRGSLKTARRFIHELDRLLAPSLSILTYSKRKEESCFIQEVVKR